MKFINRILYTNKSGWNQQVTCAFRSFKDVAKQIDTPDKKTILLFQQWWAKTANQHSFIKELWCGTAYHEQVVIASVNNLPQNRLTNHSCSNVGIKLQLLGKGAFCLCSIFVHLSFLIIFFVTFLVIKHFHEPPTKLNCELSG